VASTPVGPISWQGTGLKIGLGVGSAMYLANIKQEYKFGYINKSDTLVFAVEKEDRIDFCVVFYECKKKTRRMKFVRQLYAIKCYSDLCVIISKVEETDEMFKIVLCNSIGNPIETKLVNIEPFFVEMTKNYIVLASTDHVYVWNYRSSTGKASMGHMADSNKFGREIAFFIDEEPNPKMIYDKGKYEKLEKLSNEPICCLTANESTLIVGRTNGIVNKYTLPNLILEKKLALNGKPNNIYVNCDGTRLAIIDLANLLTFYKLDVDGNDEVLPFEKKDVWNFKWSVENPLNCTF